MEIKITKAHEIKTIEDWYDYAPPQSCKHWKDGRSAKLLAEYALSENFMQDISKILKECNLRIPKKLYGEPEAITNFPSSGTGRHHDLLIDGDEIIIAIEAKVSELFGNGKTIKNEYEDKSANKQERVKKLLEYIGKSYSEETNKYNYQLLTGFVGTLLEAQKRGKSNCLFLVMIFKGNVSIPLKEKNNLKDNEKAFSEFCGELLGLSPEGGNKSFCIKGNNITCHIKKVEVNVKKELLFSYK